MRSRRRSTPRPSADHLLYSNLREKCDVVQIVIDTRQLAYLRISSALQADKILTLYTHMQPSRIASMAFYRATLRHAHPRLPNGEHGPTVFWRDAVTRTPPSASRRCRTTWRSSVLSSWLQVWSSRARRPTRMLHAPDLVSRIPTGLRCLEQRRKFIFFL